MYVLMLAIVMTLDFFNNLVEVSLQFICSTIFKTDAGRNVSLPPTKVISTCDAQ